MLSYSCLFLTRKEKEQNADQGTTTKYNDLHTMGKCPAGKHVITSLVKDRHRQQAIRPLPQNQPAGNTILFLMQKQPKFFFKNKKTPHSRGHCYYFLTDIRQPLQPWR